MPQGHYIDVSDDDEEETVELRVSASRQSQPGEKHAAVRKMSSSTSSRMPETTQQDNIQEITDQSTRRTSSTGILDFTKCT
jgi:hypothetical protein